MHKTVTLRGGEVTAAAEMLIEYFRRESFEFCNLAGKWDSPISERIGFIESLASDEVKYRRLVFKLVEKDVKFNRKIYRNDEVEGQKRADKVMAEAKERLDWLINHVLPLLRRLT